MKAVHMRKKVRCTHDCFIVFVVLLTICGCSVSRSKIKPGHQPSSVSKEPDAHLGYTPITVFPLQNTTGKPELNWLSIGLQESLTTDLFHISDLHPKALLDFNRLIKKYCHGMTLSCIAGVSAAADATTDKVKMPDWQAIATAAKLEKFLWGSYQLQEDNITVHLHLYSGPKWTSQGTMTINAPLSKLLRESSQQILPFLKAQSISIKPEESKRIVSIKTESVTAWQHNAMGYWWQQAYLAAGEEQKKGIAGKCEGSFKKAVAADSEYAGGWTNLGYQKILTGDLNGAARAFRKALEQKPDRVNAHMGLGYCLVEKGELTNAISHLEKGVKLNPSLSDYYSYLMTTYAVLSKSTGDYDKAKNLYERALAIDEKAYGQEHPKIAVTPEQSGTAPSHHG